MAVDSFLRVTTTSSDGTKQVSDWTEVSSATLSSEAGGDAQQILDVALRTDDKLRLSLSQDFFSGNQVGIEVATYGSTSGETELVSDISANVTKLTQTTQVGAIPSYEASLADVTVTSYPYGLQGPPTTYTNNTSASNATADPRSKPEEGRGYVPRYYYARFETTDGTFLKNSVGGEWFEIQAPTSGAATPGSGTSGSGAPVLGELIISSENEDPFLYTGLLAAGIGKKLAAVQIEGTFHHDGSEIPVDSATYGTVALNATTLTDRNLSIDLSYSSVVDQTVRYDADGNVSTDSYTYNASSGSAASLTPVALPDDKISGGSESEDRLLIEGVTGDATSAAGQAYFQVDTDAVTFAYGQTSRFIGVQSANLSSTSDKLAQTFDSALFSGTSVHAWLQSSFSDGSKDVKRAMQEFKNTRVTSDALDLVTGEHSFGLAPNYYAFTAYPMNDEGKPVKTTYDLKNASPTAVLSKNAVVATIPTALSASSSTAMANGSLSSPSLQPAASATSTSGGGTFVQIRDPGHVIAGADRLQWAEVDAATTGLENIGASASGGAGAGKLHLDDLVLTIGSGDLATELDSLKTGQQLTVEVARYDGQGHLMTDTEISGVSIVSRQTDLVDDGGFTKQFAFGAQTSTSSQPTTFQQVEYGYDKRGAVVPLGFTGWNFTTNAAVTQKAPFAATTSAPPATVEDARPYGNVYVEIPDLGQNLGSTWFQLPAASLSIFPGAGPTVNGTLTLRAGMDSLTAGLDAAALSGDLLGEIDIVTSLSGSGKASLGAVVRLTDARVADSSTSASGGHSYTISFTGFGERTAAGTTAGARAPDASTAANAFSATSNASRDVPAERFNYYAAAKSGTSEAFNTASGFVGLHDFSLSTSSKTGSITLDVGRAAELENLLGRTNSQLEIAGYDRAGREVDFLLGGVSFSNVSLHVGSDDKSSTGEFSFTNFSETDGSTVASDFSTTPSPDAPPSKPPVTAAAIVSYTPGATYDPAKSIAIPLDIYDGAAIRYTATAGIAQNGNETLTVSNGTANQVTDLGSALAALSLDFSTNTAAVSLTGGAGNDILRGGAGDDRLQGGLGSNIIDGGAGNNTVSYVDFTDTESKGLLIDLGNGAAASKRPGVNDALSNIQNVIGSAYADTIVGDKNVNVIEGGGGADNIIGGGGADVASYLHSSGGVTVNLTTGVNTGGDAQGDTISGIENLYGSANADSLTGDDSANALYSKGGADSLYGMGGDDRISISVTPTLVDGGSNSINGFDNLVIEAGGNVSLSDANFTGIERVTVYGGSTLDMSGVTAAGDVPSLINSVSTVATGGSSINGTQGDDRIYAGAGGDTITGGAGNDTLIGRAGADTFRYDGRGFGLDDLIGVDTSSDHLDLSAVATSANDLSFNASADGSTTTISINGDAVDAIVLRGVTVDQAKTDGFIHYGSGNAAQMSSLHQMVQAMSSMTSSPSSALTPSAPAQPTEAHLAAAHA